MNETQLRSIIEKLQREIDERKEAERAARDFEALYSSLVENLPLHVLRKDLEGRPGAASQPDTDSGARLVATVPGRLHVHHQCVRVWLRRETVH